LLTERARIILESARMAGLELPIFELPLVLLPGEQLPLHIFEDRYKRMVGTALEQDEPFGIVLRDDEGARSIGCTARIDDVLERFDDGRLNIVVSGEAPFKVLDRFESPEFPAGEVELIPEEEVPPIDEASASAAREAFAELAERATGERPDPTELDHASAYAIAARIELPAETKQQLLEMRDEDERMTLLANALGAVGKALERAEEAAERASGNGKVQFPGT
jgi:Lon protease-like protein